MKRIDLRAVGAGVCLAVALLVTYASRAMAVAPIFVLTPLMGSQVSGTVIVTTTVGPGVWWAKLYIDGKDGPSSPPYNFTWDSTTVPNGTHTLTVKAFAEWSSTPMGVASTTVNVQNGSSGGGSSGGGGGGSGNPGYFSTLPPGATLPTEQQCASWMAQTPETVPVNATANASTPTAAQESAFQAEPFWYNWGPSSSWEPYFSKVDGNYTGSTDMILRWAACKWGIDENVVRAQAWVESGWTQSSPYQYGWNPPGWGDFTSNYATCETPGWNGWDSAIGGCYSSCGILMEKVPNYNVWPEACGDTAFSVDFRMAAQRACMDGNGESWLSGDTPSSGYPWYPNGTTDQMFWGCMGNWYSGAWYDSGALWYINLVQATVASQPWPK